MAAPTTPIKLAVFSTKPYDELYLSTTAAAQLEPSAPIEVIYHKFHLNTDTVALAKGATAVCVFVNDIVNEPVLKALHEQGVKAILLRCAGFNNVDLEVADQLGLFVANVPSYSPQAVAEFAVALLQTLNRKTHRAFNRVREANFSLNGLLGRTLYGKTVGIIGTGKIGVAMARIMNGFGCNLLAFDPFQNDEFEKLGEYVDLDTLLAQSDIVSLHCPLMPSTAHIINSTTLAKMKQDALLINTSRGGLIDTKDLIQALKTDRLGGVALDVYEAEGGLFYNDHSGKVIHDDDLVRLIGFPHVLVCGHQAFFTEEALSEIGSCTISNLADFVLGRPCKNSLIDEVKVGLLRRDSAPVRLV